MKKKILLLTVLVMAFVCLLAVSASAAIIYQKADGTVLFTAQDVNSDRVFESYTGSFPNTDEQGNALTWYIVSSETVDTNTVHTVASFLTIDTTGEHASLSNEGVYKYVNQAKELSIVSAYFPNNSNILTLNLSDDGYGDTYNFDTDTSNLLFVRLPNTLAQFPGRLGQSTPVIDCTVDENAQYTSMGATSFHGSKNLRSVDIPKNVEIIYSNGHSNNGHPFYNCISLVDVDFAEGSMLTTIQQNAFNSCSSLKEITIPNSVVNLGNNVFMYCSGLVTVRLGANAGKGLETYNVQSMLYGCNSLKYVYMSDTMVPTTGSHLFDSGAGKMVIFYTGTQEQYETLKGKLITLGNNGRFTDAKPIEWDSSKTDDYYKDLASNENKNYVVWGYNKCDAFYDKKHDLGEVNSCMAAATCDRKCGYSVSPDFEGHSVVETLVYANGFDNNGVYNCICSNASYCTAIEGYALNESVAPIITFKGYSIPEKANYKGINAGFKVDKDLLDKYNDINEVDATLTLFMVNCKSENVNISKIFEDGTLELADGVKGINVAITSTSYTNISIEVRGFDNSNEEGNYYTLNLITAIGVKTKEGVHYVQGGLKNIPNDTQNVGGIIFNTVNADQVYTAVSK